MNGYTCSCSSQPSRQVIPGYNKLRPGTNKDDGPLTPFFVRLNRTETNCAAAMNWVLPRSRGMPVNEDAADAVSREEIMLFDDLTAVHKLSAAQHDALEECVCWSSVYSAMQELRSGKCERENICAVHR